MNRMIQDSRRRFIRLFSGFSVVGLLGGADHRRHKTIPNCVPKLPPYPYRSSSPIGATSSLSLPGILVNASNPANPDLKVFQQKGTSLDYAHCSLSKVALTIKKDGNWIVSFQADQNPGVSSASSIADIVPRDSRGGILLQTSHLKRNTFHVRFRGFASASVAVTTTDVALPALVVIDLPPFVVERALPYSYYGAATTASTKVKEFFGLLDKFEVDYSVDFSIS